MANSIPNDNRSSLKTRRYVLPLIRLAIGSLVLVAIVRVVLHARQELAQSAFDWTQVRWRWLLAAVVLYAISQVPLAAYWQRILAALDVPVGLGTALRGFVAGQLGKYIPGKLMVVIIRSSLLQLPASLMPCAAASVFVETFTYMAVGAFLAGLGGLIFFRHEWLLQMVSLTVMLLMVLMTSPMLIKKIMCGIIHPRSSRFTTEANYNELNYHLVGTGWLASLGAWLLSTASLCATLQALPIDAGGGVSWDWKMPLRLGTSLAAAVVLGFASMLPGGLGAREYVLDRLLVPMLGEVRALSVTVLLRVIWLLTEVVTSSILYGYRRPRT